MIITIDQAGRLVIPKELRQRYHFQAGAQIELHPEEDGLRLNLPHQPADFREKQGILVDCSPALSPIDSTTFINTLRDSRSQELTQPGQG